MFDKKISSTQGAPSKAKPDDKSKASPSTAEPVTHPGKTPAQVAPARKS